MDTTTSTSRTRQPAIALLVGVLLLGLLTLGLPAPAHARPARLAHYFSGRVINPVTKKPVKGVIVRVFRINTDVQLGQATTGARGGFRIDRLTDADEELDVRVNGSGVRYQTGWIGCAHTVVASFGAACTFGHGAQSAFRVRHL